MRRGTYILLPLALALAGCAVANDSFSDSFLDYPRDAEAASVDWSNAETVTVALADFEFEPAQLSFHAGQAYRLQLENKGKNTHFFAAEGFFKAIATAELVTKDGSVDHPHLKEIGLAPGESKELTFVAVKKGTYALKCTAPFHEGLGMKGEITIS